MSATKLYPPVIDGKLPAQLGDTISIPYRLNVVHNLDEIYGIRLKIKTAYSNNIVVTCDSVDFKYQKSKDPDTYYATFKIPSKLEVAQYYKAQIAFLDAAGEEGNISSTGVFKYTDSPVIGINGLNNNASNTNIYNYIGQYEPHKDDQSEKEYSYKFDFYCNGELVETSGENIHVQGKEDKYVLMTDLQANEFYLVIYTVKTVNDLISSCRYVIQKQPEIDVGDRDKAIVFSVVPNEDEGFNELVLTSSYSKDAFYRILRSVEGTNIWDELVSFSVQGETSNSQPYKFFKDFTIEHGVNYKYALQQYDSYNNIYTKKLETDTVVNYFEDIFLSDGERQLKVRFNPKVSSFKVTTLEQKTDTIGSKYPYFFRNGQLGYKEIPLSGLISYWMDEAGLFTKSRQTEEEKRTSTGKLNNTIVPSNFTTNLTSQNVYNEREFKMEVLEWLNNGKPKIFRSPIEGSAIVRLNNISLSPEDTLGRMLHNFSCTAYEIADFTYKNLQEMNLILQQELSDDLPLQNCYLDPFKEENWRGAWQEVAQAKNAYFEGMPFAEVEVLLNTGEIISVTIGSTGTYHFTLKDDESIVKLKVNKLHPTSFPDSGWSKEPQWEQGFHYQSKTINAPVLDKAGKKIIGHFLTQQAIQIIGKNDLQIKRPANLYKTYYITLERDISMIQNDENLNEEKIITLIDKNDNTRDESVAAYAIVSIPGEEDELKAYYPISVPEGIIVNLFAEFETTEYEEGDEN